MASSSSGLVWSGAGWIPADSIAATNLKTPPKPPPQAPSPPPPATLAPSPAAPKAPTPTLTPVQPAPAAAPSAKPIQAAPSSPAAANYRNLASSIAGSINAQMGGAEYVVDTSGEGYDILRINPNITVTSGMKSEIEKDLGKGVKIFSGVSVEKIGDSEYRISPKVLSQPITAPSLASSTSGSSTAVALSRKTNDNPANSPLNQDIGGGASSWILSNTPTVVSPLASTTEDIVTPTILYNREVQHVNEMFQEAGIPIQYNQATLPQNEATALAYSREATAANAAFANMNAALKSFGAPGSIPALPDYNTLNKTPTGFAGFVQNIDMGWYNNPILGPLFKGADTLSTNATNTFEQDFLYKLGGQNIATDFIGNFAGAGAATIAETPKFVLELGTRSPIGAAVYAMKSGSKDVLGDVGSFYAQQGWLMAGTAGAAIISDVVDTANTGNIEDITNPPARLAGSMFVMGVLTNPKFSPDEMQYVKPGTITVDSSGTLKVSSGEWMKVPSAEEQAAVEAKLAANPVNMELTEAQKTQVEAAMDASWDAARAARIHQMISDSSLGGSDVTDAWSQAAKNAFPDWRIAKLSAKLQTSSYFAAANSPDLTIEPVVGPLSKLVETDEGDVVATAYPSGETLNGNPQYVLSMTVAPPTIVGETAGAASLISAIALASGVSVISTAQPSASATISADLQSTRLSGRNITGTATGTLNAVKASGLTRINTLTNTATLTGTVTDIGTLTKTATLTGTVTDIGTLTKTVTGTPTLVPPLVSKSTLEKKRRHLATPKLPNLRYKGKKTIRSDLISSGISKMEYGKATSPTPSADIYKRFAVGGVIPTVEMKRNKGKPKIPSLIKGIRGLFRRGKP